MAYVYHMEACSKALELLTDRNEFRELSNIGDIANWDAHLEAPKA